MTLSLTKSKYKFETNQKVIATTNGVKIRPRPNTTDKTAGYDAKNSE